MEEGVGAASQNMAGSILVACAVGAVARSGWECFLPIGFTVSVGQFARPKVPPSGLEDLDLFFPGVGGGGPDMG